MTRRPLSDQLPEERISYWIDRLERGWTPGRGQRPRALIRDLRAAVERMGEIRDLELPSSRMEEIAKNAERRIEAIIRGECVSIGEEQDIHADVQAAIIAALTEYADAVKEQK